MIYKLPGSGTQSQTRMLEELPKEDEFQKLASALKRRWRVFLYIFGAFFLLSVAYGLAWPKKYTTTVNIVTGNSAQNANGLNTDIPVLNALIAASGVQSVETYATMIQDQTLAAAVIDDLKLHITPFELLKYDILVLPVTNTQIVTLQASWKDKNVSAKIANTFAAELIKHDRDMVAAQSQQAMDYLAGELPKAYAEMNRADKSLSDFQAKHTIADLATQTQSTVGQYSDTIARIAQLQVDLSQASASLASSQDQMTANPRSMNGGSNIASNPVVMQLQQQLATVNVQLAAARKQYTDRHPTVIALEQQQTLLVQEIKNQPTTYVASNAIVPNPLYQQLEQQSATLRSQIAGDQSQLGVLRQQLNQMDARVSGLPAVAIQMQTLQREAQLAENIYSTMKQKFNDARVARTMALPNVYVEMPAESRFAAPLPNTLATIMLGFVLGLMLATSGVFVVDFFDQSIKDEGDVRRVLGLPVLASVPELSQISKRDMAKLPMLRALTIEAYLQLVTSLRYSSDKPLRTLTVTSALQNDGKSTVALNTAIAMAEIRPKVLLIDADMRRPTLHEKLGLPLGPGLTEILVGETTADQVIHTTRYSGLHVITSGTLSPNPIKLIQAAVFDELVDQLVKTYSMVVFDTPALLPMVDATAVGAKTDATVLVVSAGTTDSRSAKRAIARLNLVEGVNLLGVLLNRATPNPRESAYFLTGGSPLPLQGDGV